jgi:hypothetical protein
LPKADFVLLRGPGKQPAVGEFGQLLLDMHNTLPPVPAHA